jgi:hypothetical protein
VHSQAYSSIQGCTPSFVFEYSNRLENAQKTAEPISIAQYTNEALGSLNEAHPSVKVMNQILNEIGEESMIALEKEKKQTCTTPEGYAAHIKHAQKLFRGKNFGGIIEFLKKPKSCLALKRKYENAENLNHFMSNENEFSIDMSNDAEIWKLQPWETIRNLDERLFKTVHQSWHSRTPCLGEHCDFINLHNLLESWSPASIEVLSENKPSNILNEAYQYSGQYNTPQSNQINQFPSVLQKPRRPQGIPKEFQSSESINQTSLKKRSQASSNMHIQETKQQENHDLCATNKSNPNQASLKSSMNFTPTELFD